MSIRSIPVYSNEAEARKVTSRTSELPQCEKVRLVAAGTAVAQFALNSNILPGYDLTLVVQFGFALIGFVVAAYLLRDRAVITNVDIYDEVGVLSSFMGIIRTLPLPQMATVILLVLMLPRMLAMDGFRVPLIAELPEIVVNLFTRYFSDFQKMGFSGRNLMAFPLFVLFVPRRCLSLVLLTVLGSGMMLQFVSLFSGSIRPAALFVNPSAFDLLAAGSLMAIVTRQRRIGQSEAQIGLSAVFSGVMMAGGLVICRVISNRGEIGSVSLFSAPNGFGLSNFIIEIVGTTLIFSLSWRDIGGIFEDARRAPGR